MDCIADNIKHGGSNDNNEYPQSPFRNKNIAYPCKTKFYCPVCVWFGLIHNVPINNFSVMLGTCHHFLGVRFVSNQVGNPKERFSGDTVHIKMGSSQGSNLHRRVSMKMLNTILF